MSLAAARAHAQFRATRRFGSLDALRCLAVLPVVWHHATPRPLPGVLGKGPLGVDLFFCISGWLIVSLLLRERDATGRVDEKAFYLRRARRIFPLYYTVLFGTVLFALTLPDGPQRAHFFRSLPFFATFTGNWLVDFGVQHPILFAYSWSLAVEEQFYAFFPWLLRARRHWAATLCAALLLLDQAAEHDLLGLSGLGWRIVTSLSTPILLGALCAFCMHEVCTFRALWWLLGSRLAAPAAALAVVACVLGEPPLWLVHMALTTLVASCVVREDHGLCTLTRSPLAAHLGKVSYGIYMLHGVVLGAVKRWVPAELHQGLWVFVLGLPLSVLLATLSHRSLEAYFLRPRSTARAQKLPLTPA